MAPDVPQTSPPQTELQRKTVIGRVLEHGHYLNGHSDRPGRFGHHLLLIACKPMPPDLQTALYSG